LRTALESDGQNSIAVVWEAIALVCQRLNASSGRAAAVVREALKSGELRIIRDDHIDPMSGSLFAIVEEDFLDWLNRHCDHAVSRAQAARSRAGKAGCD